MADFADRIAEIERRLDEIDRETTRPIRALISGYATDRDREKIRNLEGEAIALRSELNRLRGGVPANSAVRYESVALNSFLGGGSPHNTGRPVCSGEF